MTILITGGMGFIGLHTVKAFTEAGEDVVATYYETWRVPSFLEQESGKQVVWVQADITNHGALVDVIRRFRVDGIVHLAIHGRALSDPGEDLRMNMDKLTPILDAARHGGARRVSLASSLAIYFSLPRGPFHEADPIPLQSSMTPEAFKKAWEVLSSNYAANYAASQELEVVNMRISAVYGPLYRSMLNLPSRLCHAAAKGTPPDFSQERGGAPHIEDTHDLTYVKDVAEGIRLVHTAPTLRHNVYNIGSGRAVTTRDLLEAVRKVKPEVPLQVREGKGPRYRDDAYMDISRISSELGYRPQYTIESGIAEYIAWLEAGNSV